MEHSWECEVCTFINVGSFCAQACSMCTSPNPNPPTEEEHLNPGEEFINALQQTDMFIIE